MPYILDDTIVAPATAPGPAAISIVRISGTDTINITDSFLKAGRYRSVGELPPRYLIQATLTDHGNLLDQCLAVFFKGPASYTGEDCIELHLHGNSLILDHVLSLAIGFGARFADPGEFTRRAFLNGKMDLTQAEALADVIASESDIALFLSQRQLRGELRRKLDRYRTSIISILANIELELDFVEDGYSFQSIDEIRSLISGFQSFTSELLGTYQTGMRLRQGPRVLLFGLPNAGKSSLFNAILGFSRALVSPLPGTTRDYLEETITYNGITLHFVDTAGDRLTEDIVESEGVRISHDLIPVCDHVLYLIDSINSEPIPGQLAKLSRLREDYPLTNFTPVMTKHDPGDSRSFAELSCSIYDRSSIVRILDLLTADYSVDVSSQLALLNQRQYLLLTDIGQQLDSISVMDLASTEVLSFQLRSLLNPLSELSGQTTNEDILQSVFSSFCIGK